jgi:hypothetical protein
LSLILRLDHYAITPPRSGAGVCDRGAISIASSTEGAMLTPGVRYNILK